MIGQDGAQIPKSVAMDNGVWSIDGEPCTEAEATAAMEEVKAYINAGVLEHIANELDTQDKDTLAASGAWDSLERLAWLIAPTKISAKDVGRCLRDVLRAVQESDKIEPDIRDTMNDPPRYLDFACPHCNVRAGRLCVNPKGIEVGPHSKRFRLGKGIDR